MIFQTSIGAQCLTCFAANIGTFFVTGMITGWSTTVFPAFSSPSPLNLTGDEIGWIMCIVGVGGVIAPVLTWLLIDRMGRKAIIMFAALPMTVSYLVMAAGMDYAYFLVGRALAGVGMGITVSTVPLYIGEITEASVRGAMGVVSGVTYNCGILFSIIVGPYVSVRHLNMICALMTCILASTMILAPESPYFYLMKGNTEKAIISLQRLRRITDVSAEMKIISEYVEEKKSQTSKTFDLFTKRGNRRALVILVILSGVQLFSGFLAIPTYAYKIFNDSGYDISVDAMVIIMGVVSLISSTFGIFVLHKFGRRTVLFVTSAIMSLCLIVDGTFYILKDAEYDVSNFTVLPFIAVIGFTISVSCGIQNLPTIVLSEYFSTSVKAKAAMTFSIISAIFGSSSVKIFQMSADHLGLGLAFYICFILLILGTIALYFIMPETKGCSLQNIEKMHNGISLEPVTESVAK